MQQTATRWVPNTWTLFNSGFIYCLTMSYYRFITFDWNWFFNKVIFKSNQTYFNRHVVNVILDSNKLSSISIFSSQIIYIPEQKWSMKKAKCLLVLNRTFSLDISIYTISIYLSVKLCNFCRYCKYWKPFQYNRGDKASSFTSIQKASVSRE